MIAALLALATLTARTDAPTTGTQRPAQLGLVGAARAIDGDTIEIAGARVRLWGIDAPESDQLCTDGAGAGRFAGEGAQAHLAALLHDTAVTCEALYEDRYGRTVARCTAHGAEIAARMVADGWAWDYARYSDGAYAPEEDAARARNIGVWAWRCTAPWRWRAEAGA